MTQSPPYQVTDPATGEVVQTYPHATDAEVEAALAASAAAFETWRSLPVAERARIVKRVGALFLERAAELGALVTREMGKRPSSATGEAAYSSTIFDYYADNGPALLADRPLPGHDGARVQHLPIGPLLGVMPWNYPYSPGGAVRRPEPRRRQHGPDQACGELPDLGARHCGADEAGRRP